MVILSPANAAPIQELRRGVKFAVSPIQGTLAGATRSVTSIFDAIGQIDQRRRRQPIGHPIQNLLFDRLRHLNGAAQGGLECIGCLLGLQGALLVALAHEGHVLRHHRSCPPWTARMPSWVLASFARLRNGR